MIQSSPNNIFFFWNGPISETRLKILRDCVYSTRIYNKNDPIYLISDTLKSSDFHPRMRIDVIPLSDDLFEDIPVSEGIVSKYRSTDPRSFSDFFRLVLLYKFGGSYVDTDDLCFAPYDRKYKNVVCRSYDPHTAFYNKIQDHECMSGIHREIRGYDHIPFFPRNDCWSNFDSHHFIIKDIFDQMNFMDVEAHPLYIIGNESFQSMTLKAAKAHENRLNDGGFQFGLNLIYLFEDFVAGCSSWDRGDRGGEMHDIYKTLEMSVEKQPWGRYRCDQTTASYFFWTVLKKYPTLTHLWLHSKDQEPEWFVDVNPNELYYLSTWEYKWQKDLINLELQRV